jgi:outer membrane murein-binding lipoprotein Lpp
MKIKSQLTFATLIVSGMFATGCQQLSKMNPVSQQTAGASQQQTAAPEVKPAETAPAASGTAHTHPAIPGCTNSVTHTHPFTDPNHTHHYSCKPNSGSTGVAVPKVKAKGKYKGSVTMDKSSKEVMQQYQQK